MLHNKDTFCENSIAMNYFELVYFQNINVRTLRHQTTWKFTPIIVFFAERLEVQSNTHLLWMFLNLWDVPWGLGVHIVLSDVMGGR